MGLHEGALLSSYERSKQPHTDRNDSESYRLPNRPVKTKPARTNDTKEDKGC